MDWLLHWSLHLTADEWDILYVGWIKCEMCMVSYLPTRVLFHFTYILTILRHLVVFVWRLTSQEYVDHMYDEYLDHILFAEDQWVRVMNILEDKVWYWGYIFLYHVHTCFPLLKESHHDKLGEEAEEKKGDNVGSLISAHICI